MEFILFFLFMQGMVFGLFCRYIAGEKRRSKQNWFALGFFFSALALVAIAVVPVNQKLDHSNADPYLHVKCPDCRRLISKDTILCEYCGCKLISQKILSPKKIVPFETESGDLNPALKVTLIILICIVVFLLILIKSGVIRA